MHSGQVTLRRANYAARLRSLSCTCAAATGVCVASSIAVSQPSNQSTVQVEQLRGAVVQVLEARRQGQVQAAALQELKGAYNTGPDATDFQAALSGRAAALAAAQP